MIGLSTYAFFWQLSERAPVRLTLTGALEATRELGISLIQICDYPALDTMTDAELSDLAEAANDLGISIELGTRGIEPRRLDRFLHLAQALDAKLVRSMLPGLDTPEEIATAAASLSGSVAAYERASVTLALETYEQVSTVDLVQLVNEVGSDQLGICLDPANVVARLELPRDCVERSAALVKNVHSKDFRFARQDGWVGFTYSGAPLGTGLHDYQHLLATVQPRERGINEIVEHWLPWQQSPELTIQTEREWTRDAIAYLRSTE
ncbi:sugar phosphate isomerase/epimerase family protein [Lysinibacter cavernae]|uniref:Sugar phosphate isomerase/epimerase n=1 Tax=Lysinibacter cavernae TaxID=1640652 RepID=A0A7X5R0P0_9MICO|nr:TIM barrel protein [Lysinibacter cavernae]NIH53426.1 sugar phosphate isomerase/epimerase [Lysinibacter cavernae]